jgi:hypothetical protein
MILGIEEGFVKNLWTIWTDEDLQKIKEKALDWSPYAKAGKAPGRAVKHRDSKIGEPSERMYSAAEVAKIWGVSVDLVRDTFRGEPGVMKHARPRTRTKRQYNLIRIPQSVLKRVHQRLTS